MRCSLATAVEASHMTICYTIAVYMVYTFLGEGASETRVGTLTGLLVGWPPAFQAQPIVWVMSLQ